MYRCHNFYFKIMILRRSKVANFDDIIKIMTMFIKKNLKDCKKFKRIRNYVLKCDLYPHFLIKHKMQISVKKLLISTERKECVYVV